ncbi:TetR/AcrR family transcriptional regulator [Simiduia agarivorans]|uniref:TetR family transcriptional regulator n=1 Tax=Simiduia agarivorans (strain DSM 21679 / JCM 13881 / BCRC 17597 / SA1) TaxID=1117647 RepID=K4KE09_SIMAS|nr:TetR/AcrR family transcriptional regulator [Simiduia agarivorans]AFU97264.1 TetR family transcriptional regulator [Simiduia agarivorans SA1 = DSM 21679]
MAYQETDYTRQNKADTRNALLRAGHKLLAKKGFSAISIAGVAQQAGMATGNVYRYFKNKSALVVALFERATQYEIEAVFDSVNALAPAEIQLRTLLTAFAQRANANPVLSYALLAEPVTPELEAARQTYKATWAGKFQQVIQQGIQQQVFVEQPVQVAAVAIVAVMADSLILPDPYARLTEQHIEHLVNFCLRALLTGDPQ